MNAENRRALIVGQGSIGVRHRQVLRELGVATAVVSRRGPSDPVAGCYRAIGDAVADFAPNYVVIATETASHLDDLMRTRALYAGDILMEKPLFAGVNPVQVPAPERIYVAYQFRFHPLLQALRDAAAGSRVISAQFYAGQHLADWRPGRDVRDNYSAWRAAGGGVLRDLSHEFDMALWLFGSCKRLTASGGRLSDVTVDSDDAWSVLAEFERCSLVSFHLNCLDRPSRRQIVLTTDSGTIDVDFVAGRMGDRVYDRDRNIPLRAMHEAILSGHTADACSCRDGWKTVGIIEAVENAASGASWVHLS